MSKTAWTGLFDTGEIEHVRLEVLPDLVERETSKAHAIPFQKYLLEPLEAFFRDQRSAHTGVDAAYKLQTVVERIVEKISSSTLAATDADVFWFAWLEFSAHNASYLMYHTKARQSASGKAGADGQTRPRKLPSAMEIKEIFDELLKTRSVKDARSVLHRRYSNTATDQAINNLMRKAGIPVK
jgi:hypothetical protein